MDAPPSWFRRLRPHALTALCVVACATVVPRTLVGREGDALYDGDLRTQHGLARAVAASVSHDLGPEAFHTGSSRFDGEWAFGSNQMAALGLAQTILAHPETRAELLPALRLAVDHLLASRTWRFAIEAWGEDPFASLDSDHGHAYLGYAALALGALRTVDPATPHAALHDRMVRALARRLERSPTGAIETYPGEAYPCDMASVIGALGQHARLTGTDRRALLTRMATVYRTRWIDRSSGYLAQSVNATTGAPFDAPRASGTALAAYFWRFADPAMAATLATGLARSGDVSLAGFGAVREYAPGHRGHGDIDSGPVVLGLSLSGTGFSLAAARFTNDRARFARLYRTAALFGVPVSRGATWRYASGGPIGNAILLAMVTAR